MYEQSSEQSHILPEQGGTQFGEVDYDLRRTELLNAIAEGTQAIARIKSETAAAVHEARNLRVTWKSIGEAAQITPQAANRKWDIEARKRHSDSRRSSET